MHYPWLPVRRLLLDRYPSIDRIGALTAPVLVIAGESDDIVPASQTRRLFDAAPQPKDYVVIDGAGHNDPAIEYGLRAVERRLVYERLEVAAGRHAVVRALDLAHVDRVPHHLPEALRRERQSAASTQPGLGGAGDDLLLREARRRQFVERPSHERPRRRV